MSERTPSDRREWSPDPPFPPKVSYGNRSLTLSEIKRAIEERRRFASLSPLQERWLARVFVHLWRNSTVEQRQSFAASFDAIRDALRVIGRGLDAPWLAQWLFFDFYRGGFELRDEWEELIRRGTVREGWKDDAFPWGRNTRRLNPDVPVAGVLLEGRPGEHLVQAVERWLLDLAELQGTLRNIPLPRHPGPTIQPTFRNIEWTWRYYVEKKTFHEIADDWAEEAEAVEDETVKTYVARVARELGLRRPRGSGGVNVRRPTPEKVEAFETHVGLTLRYVQKGRLQQVTITGDREKVLYEGGDKRRAKATYAYAVEVYKQRRIAGEIDEQLAACDDPDCPERGQHPSHLEREVPYFA